eukprot:gene1088-1236_t
MAERYENSRTKFQDACEILIQQAKLMEIVERYAAHASAEYPMSRVKQLWAEAWRLISIMIDPEIGHVTDQQWKNASIPFGELLVATYKNNSDVISTYMHIFIEHVGEMLEKFGCLDRFGNYGLEGKHYLNKILYSRHSNMQRYTLQCNNDPDAKSSSYQQMEKSNKITIIAHTNMDKYKTLFKPTSKGKRFMDNFKLSNATIVHLLFWIQRFNAMDDDVALLQVVGQPARRPARTSATTNVPIVQATNVPTEQEDEALIRSLDDVDDMSILQLFQYNAAMESHPCTVQIYKR